MRTGKHLNREAINRNTSIPIYHQIYTQLKKELMLGGYAQGDRFYSFRKLSGIYGVEPRTVGDALELLSRDGFIEKKAASGMYVGDLRKVMAKGVFTGNIWYVLMGNESFDHPFYFRLLKGIEKAIHHTGLKLTVGIKETPQEFFSWFTPAPDDGIILTGEIKPSFLKDLKQIVNENMVVVGKYEKIPETPNLSVDIENGVRRGLEKSRAFGISSIALVAGPENRYITKLLKNTVKEFTFRNEIKWLRGDFSENEDGYEAIKRLKGKYGKIPNCLLATEPAYFGICRYVAENKIKCPDDLCIIRYGKEPSMKIYNEYAAVNIFLDTEGIGAKAVEILLNKEENEIAFEMQVEVYNGGKLSQLKNC